MRRQGFLWAGIVALASLGAGRAEAGPLALEATGAFGPTSTLAGSPFDVDTPYAFRAVFDPTDDVRPTPGAGFFRVTQFTITIAGHGTFAGIPSDGLNVVLLDPSYEPMNGEPLNAYAAGLVNAVGGTPFFLDIYSAVTPPFVPHTPTPTTFLGYIDTLSGFPYVIPLAGGAGELVINDVGDTPRTASLVAVPEPSSLVLAGLGGLALFVGRRRLCEV